MSYPIKSTPPSSNQFSSLSARPLLSFSLDISYTSNAKSPINHLSKTKCVTIVNVEALFYKLTEFVGPVLDNIDRTDDHGAVHLDLGVAHHGVDHGHRLE